MINVETEGDAWYTSALMSRAKKEDKQQRIVSVTFKVTETMVEELDRIVEKETRSRSQVGFLLLQRGLELYGQDGKLLIPEKRSPSVPAAGPKRLPAPEPVTVHEEPGRYAISDQDFKNVQGKRKRRG